MERYQERIRYIYLLNMAIPFGFLLFFPLLKALLGGVILVVFATLYWVSFRGTTSTRWVAFLGQTAILGLMMVFYNVNYIWMVFYPAALLVYATAGRRSILVWCMVLLGGVVVIAGFMGIRSQDGGAIYEWPILFSAIIGMVAAVLMVLWQRQTWQTKMALEAANRELERLTKIAERERISQDLHDVMGHDLSMITLKAQLISRVIDKDPGRAKAEVHDVETAARRALARVREYIAEMRQPDLREEWQEASRLLQSAGIDCEAEWDLPQGAEFSSSMSGLAMAFREAVTNLARHSDATRCSIRVWRSSGEYRLLIQDDGRGFLSGGSEERGHGLTGMRGRVEAMGGQMGVWSNGSWVTRPPLDAPDLGLWSAGTAVYLAVPDESFRGSASL